MTEAEKALREASEAYSKARDAFQASQTWNVAGLTPEQRAEQDFAIETLIVDMRVASARLEDARRDATFAALNERAKP